MAEDNPELQAKLRELDHELEVRGFICDSGRLGHLLRVGHFKHLPGTG